MLTAAEVSAAAGMTDSEMKGFLLVVGLVLLWLWVRD